MKKIYYIGIIGIAALVGFTTIQTQDNCDKKAITATCKRKWSRLNTIAKNSLKLTSLKKHNN
ncbi:MAG: hypothetical protein IPH89_13715 [Bacteroidetes bacterium]|nr:hypothetical protein [Bacteroidota bacterium]